MRDDGMAEPAMGGGTRRQRTVLLRALVAAACMVLLHAGCAPAPEHDVLILNGIIYDGSGEAPYAGDIAIDADRIVAVGPHLRVRARTTIDASGPAVAPGFINMLSWANESLIEDGRSQGDLRQGVTLEVMGEGDSMGPANDAMKKLSVEQQIDIAYDVTWTTLGEYLDMLETRGISTNVASFVGATTVRIHELGYEDRRPTDVEIKRMRALVRQAMEEGALGVSSSLIYAPAFYARTPELVELSKVAAQYGGVYISRIRSEGNRLLEAVDELITVARLLGRYVRDEKVVPLEEAVRRLTSLPAANLGIEMRGHLAPGYYADLVVFDPALVKGNATFESPHQYATGVLQVLVNGTQVLKDGEHTGATPGRVVHGPGWKERPRAGPG